MISALPIVVLGDSSTVVWSFFRHCFIFGIRVFRGFSEAKARLWDVGLKL